MISHHHLTCLDHLGWCNRGRNISILCCGAQGGQCKYMVCRCCWLYHNKLWQSLKAKLSAISHHHLTCLDHLGRQNRGKIISILCCTTQGGQGKYIVCPCHWHYHNNFHQLKHGLWKHLCRNTKGGSITVPLTSCLTCLESAV